MPLRLGSLCCDLGDVRVGEHEVGRHDVAEVEHVGEHRIDLVGGQRFAAQSSGIARRM